VPVTVAMLGAAGYILHQSEMLERAVAPLEALKGVPAAELTPSKVESAFDSSVSYLL
jgi:hypothetical protein